MRYLSGKEEIKALEHIALTAKIALGATCERSMCGSSIFQGDELIGSGINSPPNNDENQRRCSSSKELLDRKVVDKTCCVHAEQRAIMDALRNNPAKIIGARLYFVRLGEDKQPKKSGNPYCTMCSKMALDVGLAEFVLWHKQGVCIYDTAEYNLLSFKYKE